MGFLFWLAGLVIALLTGEVFTRISRWQVASTRPRTKNSFLETAPVTLLMILLSFGAIVVAGIPLYRFKFPLELVLPAIALAGWCNSWARGLERFVDSCYPNRTLSTMNLQEAALIPSGVLLIGLIQIYPFKSPLESLVAGAFLLPGYFVYSVLLAKRAYPAVRFEPAVLQSMAARFATGALVVGALAWVVWTYLPVTRRIEISQLFWWFLPYMFSTPMEHRLTQRLSEKSTPLEPEVVAPAQLTVTVATVETSEEVQTISLSR